MMSIIWRDAKHVHRRSEPPFFFLFFFRQFGKCTSAKSEEKKIEIPKSHPLALAVNKFPAIFICMSALDDFLR